MRDIVLAGGLTWTKNLAHAPKSLASFQCVVIWYPKWSAPLHVYWQEARHEHGGWYVTDNWAPIQDTENAWWTIITMPNMQLDIT